MQLQIARLNKLREQNRAPDVCRWEAGVGYSAVVQQFVEQIKQYTEQWEAFLFFCEPQKPLVMAPAVWWSFTFWKGLEIVK